MRGLRSMTGPGENARGAGGWRSAAMTKPCRSAPRPPPRSRACRAFDRPGGKRGRQAWRARFRRRVSRAGSATSANSFPAGRAGDPARRLRAARPQADAAGAGIPGHLEADVHLVADLISLRARHAGQDQGHRARRWCAKVVRRADGASSRAAPSRRSAARSTARGAPPAALRRYRLAAHHRRQPATLAARASHHRPGAADRLSRHSRAAPISKR